MTPGVIWTAIYWAPPPGPWRPSDFPRPEDLHTNPADGLQAVFASTGHATRYPADIWGTLYRINVEYALASRGGPVVYASLTIIYDGDVRGERDHGIRSPDNLVWAGDGFVYVQEDRALDAGLSAGEVGTEASLWKLDPASGETARIAVMRQVLAPAGVTDASPDEPGD